MRLLRRGILVAVLVLGALMLIGVDRSVDSGAYTVHSGQTLHGGLFISSPGVVTIEEGARVDGAIFMGSGVLNVNGEVGGGIFSLSGEVHTGPNAVIRGHTTVTSVPFEAGQGTRFENNLAADVAGWIGGPIGAALVLLALAALAIYEQRMWLAGANGDEARAGATSLLKFLAGVAVVIGAIALFTQGLNVTLTPARLAAVTFVLSAALFVAVLIRGRQSGWLAVPASVLLATGAVLGYHAQTGYWQSWAYLWPLVLPGAFGIGRIIEGWWARNAEQESSGLRLVGLGVALGALGLIFFEFVAERISGSSLLLATLLLIGITGLFVLLAGGIRPARRATGA